MHVIHTEQESAKTSRSSRRHHTKWFNSDSMNFNVNTSLWTKYGNVINSLHTCLAALNLTEYYRTQNYLKKAEVNVVESLDNYLRLLKPTEMVDTPHNYCYRVKAELNMNSTHLSGFIGSHSFHQQTSLMDSFVIRSLRIRFSTDFRTSFVYACLPKVFLAGFPKCGSTFVHDFLISHPHVSRSVIKEPHLWDRVPASYRGFETLTAYFALYMYNFSPRLDIENSRTQVAVDASPHTVNKWPRFPGDDSRTNICLLPVVLPALIPKLRFIIVMRNPVDATYSMFWFSCTNRNGTVPKELLDHGPDIFHDRVVTKINTFKQCLESYPIAKCAFDPIRNESQSNTQHKGETQYCGTARMDVYMYYIHIAKWLAVYPRKRFMFLTLEELSGKYARSVHRPLWKFIGVNPRYKLAPHFSKPSNEQQKVDYHHDPHLMMRQDTRDILEDFFEPFNMRLAHLLNNTKFLWNQKFGM